MATASALGRPTPHDTVSRPNMVSVGTIVWLASELMFFSALFAMYFTIRSVSDVWPAKGVELDIPFDGSITLILVLSSVTCQAGVFAAERGQLRRTGSVFNVGRWGTREWIILTFIMGAIFVGGQCYEYANFVTDYHATGEGMTIASSAYGSVFYITTGFHALHVTGGLFAFLYLLARLGKGKFTPGKLTSTIVVSYYWHFVDIVWIALFSVVFLVQ